MSNNPARLLLRDRVQVSDRAFAELVIWRVPTPVRGSRHPYKYRHTYVVDGVCVVRYDNEAGKGDHRHVGHMETAYSFTSPSELIADFWRDARRAP